MSALSAPTSQPSRWKCERCNDTRKIRTYRKLGDTTPQIIDCPDCAQPERQASPALREAAKAGAMLLQNHCAQLPADHPWHAQAALLDAFAEGK